MNLIPYRSWRRPAIESTGLSQLGDFRGEMGRLMDSLFNRQMAVPTWFEAASPVEWLPAIDISEDATQLLVRAELPGIDPQALDIDVTEDRLVISGEKKQATSKTGNGWTHMESQYGTFTRTIPLPTPVDPEKVTARFENGVLTVELAKAETSVTRKVPVLAG